MALYFRFYVRLSQQKKRKSIDFGVSLLEDIVPVLVAFMEFIPINEVVMWFMNKIVVLF